MSTSQDDLFQRIKADFLQAVQEGGSPSRVELLHKYPELAAQLNELFAEVDRTPPHNQPETATLPPDNAGVDKYATLPPETGDHEFATIVPAHKSIALPMTAGSRTGTKVRYFGDYELLSEIARGGMGVVYKARQVNLNRIVALKMILAGQLASDEDVKRFYTEAEAAANLDHPGIVPIFEIGEHDGQHYFSMGFIEGNSLADQVKDGPLPPTNAASIVRKISEAIAYAHEKGVIHRDLKPANVLMDVSGEPKVTDFGLARKLEQDSGLTRTGAVMGTPSYMPPEQAAGKTDQVGPWADVYSLGAILYCLLTGRPPFQASNPIDTLMQVIEREPVAPTVLNPQVPRDLETICLKCLQKDRVKRYESAKDLAADIGRWQKGEPIKARAVSRTERVWRWVKRNPVVSGLMAATMIGLIISMYLGIRAVQSESAATASKEKTEAALARSNYFLAQARWEENRIVEARNLLHRVPQENRKFEWYLAHRGFEGSELTFYGHSHVVTSVSFSPDGTRIASGSEDKTVKLWDAATGEELITLRGHTDNVSSVNFSPDGTRIASGSWDQMIKLWKVATGEEITTLKGNIDGILSVSFSPDGTRIASGSYDKIVKLWDAATEEEFTTLRTYTGGVRSMSFSPDGTRIASVDDKTVKLWDAATGEVLTTLKGHTEGVNSVSFSSDGTRIASGSYDKTIKLWDAATGAEITTLKGHTSFVSSVSFSSDGTRIASGSEDKTIKLWDAATGEALTTLKGHTEGVSSVNFSPDGTRIASGSWIEVKLWNAATGEEIATLMGHTGGVNSVSFSPDGTRIAAASGEEGSGNVMDDNSVKLWNALTGTEITTLIGHTNGVTSVSFSPDGTRIASGSHDKTVKLWDAATGEEITTLRGHTGGVRSMSFSPDGTRIASGSYDGIVKLWDAATGVETTTLEGHTTAVHDLSFSPDGKRIFSRALDQKKLIWDRGTGKTLFVDNSNALFNNSSDSYNSARSPDGRWLAMPLNENVLLVDLAFRSTSREKLRREALARPKPRWHREQSLAAESGKDWYAATFHRAWLLKLDPTNGWAFELLHEAHRKLLASNNGQMPSVPPIVSKMLEFPRGLDLPHLTEESAESVENEIWNLVKTPGVNEPARVSAWHAQRMQDVCSRFPQVSYFNTLGVLQYRLGQLEAGIESLTKCLELKASETEPSGPHPIALAFLALCHYQLSHTDEVAQFRQQLNETMKNEMWVLNPELQTILVDVQSVIDGPDAVQPAGTLDDFNLEAGFEELSQHRWRFWPNADNAAPFAVSAENPHSGKTCLRVQVNESAVMAHQTITVTTNTTYRLTGWIRTEIEVPAAAEPQPEADVAVTKLGDPPVPVTGVCFGIVDREDVSESMTGTSDWKQITWEFNSNDSSTLTLGCRVGLPGNPCTGTAWFDDLVLEKVEN